MAVRYSKMDGRIDHDSESIYGEQFLSAIEASAFFEKDIARLIQNGLVYVPNNSGLSICIQYIINEHFIDTDWRKTRRKIVSRFGSSDASYSVINIGIVIMALLHGHGDFEKTLLIAVNSGYDTDCTAATACAILGIINGADGIPCALKDKIGDEIETGTISIEPKKHLMENLVKDTCEAGLSMARDGIISTAIIRVPENVKASLPLPVKNPVVSVDILYNGMPSIGPGEKAMVTVVLKNNTNKQKTGTLFIKTPEALQTNIEKMKLRISPQSEIQMGVEFETKPGLSALPQKNITTVQFVSNEKEVAEKSFGLSGAYRMKLIGPFFDNYDTEKYGSDPYKDVQQKLANVNADLFAMFNGYVNIDRQYIDETFAEVDEIEGEYDNFHTDRFEIDEKVGYKGPCCIYLIYDFICPEEYDNAAIFIGNNDAYKVWLNGKLVMESAKSTMYMPYNNYKHDVHIKKGTNRIAMKIVRIGKGFEFSCMLRNVRNNHHWFVDLASILEKG